MRSFAAVAIVAIAASHAVAAVEDDLRDGDKFFDERDYKRAAAAYDRAIAKAPGQVAAEAYAKRAAIFIILRDFQGGLDFIARAKQRYPASPELREQEALILWESGRRDDAIAVAEKVVRARPSAFTNQKLIGEYYATRDPAKTVAAFEAYLTYRPPELEGGDVVPRIRLGFAYLARARAQLGEDEYIPQGLYTKAAEQFEHVQRKLGRKANALVNAENGLCAAYTGLGRWDEAINICEHVVADPKRIDATGSAWFNLSTAYLARRQTKKARNSATEFARIRKNETRGLMLLGDTYFDDRDYPAALDHYLRAEKALRPNQTREQVELSIQLGKTYRRLPASSGDPAKNLELAIAKLTTAWTADGNSIDLAIELGSAYLAAHQDAKVVALTDKLLAGDTFTRVPAARRAAVYVLAGKALFNQRKLADARQRFERARDLRPADVQVRADLVLTINEQAFDAKDTKDAQRMLMVALGIDPHSAITLTNIAVLDLERGDCDGALRQLGELRDVRGTDTVVVARLRGRALLCATKPDRAKAAESFALAEREAKQARAQLALAEIYTEWAPLVWDTDPNAAVDKLEQALTIAASNPDVAPVARRNLALALYRRGWKLARDGKAADAAADFERALRDPTALQGSEPLAFQLSLAFAQLDANRSAEAARQFKQLAAAGNASSYLKPTFAKIGAAFFPAYSTYRTATGTARQHACSALSRLEGDLGPKTRELVASCWELVAFDHWRAGAGAAAQKALTAAERSASTEQKRRLDLDRAVLSLGKDDLSTLESLAATLPEALVDLGIVYDLLGRRKDAYDAWTRAKARGITTRDLQKWIDAKKRIHGY